MGQTVVIDIPGCMKQTGEFNWCFIRVGVVGGGVGGGVEGVFVIYLFLLILLEIPRFN